MASFLFLWAERRKKLNYFEHGKLAKSEVEGLPSK